jgi:hypothetical protein
MRILTALVHSSLLVVAAFLLPSSTHAQTWQAGMPSGIDEIRKDEWQPGSYLVSARGSRMPKFDIHTSCAPTLPENQAEGCHYLFRLDSRGRWDRTDCPPALLGAAAAGDLTPILGSKSENVWRLFVDPTERKAAAWNGDFLIPIQKYDERAPDFFEYDFSADALRRSSTRHVQALADAKVLDLRAKFRSQVSNVDWAGLELPKAWHRTRDGETEVLTAFTASTSEVAMLYRFTSTEHGLVLKEHISSIVTLGSAMCSQTATERWQQAGSGWIPSYQRRQSAYLSTASSELSGTDYEAMRTPLDANDPEGLMRRIEAARQAISSYGNQEEISVMAYQPGEPKIAPPTRLPRYTLNERIGYPGPPDFSEVEIRVIGGTKKR